MNIGDAERWAYEALWLPLCVQLISASLIRAEPAGKIAQGRYLLPERLSTPHMLPHCLLSKS